jgi:ABC-type multidrug transport system ATPase subunit
MIRIEGLVKRYGSLTAVDGLSLQVRPGEVVALIGPNGAGKSTTLKALVGLVRPDAGRLFVDGIDLLARPLEGRARLGYLPQDVSFRDGWSGRSAVDFFRRLRRLGGAETGRVLETTGLAFAADRRVGGYSGGMRQRLGLAVALLGPPAALVLDEPAISLDPLFHLELRRILSELRDGGTPVLLTSHLLPEVEALADRVALCRGGRLLAVGTLGELAAARGLSPLTRLHVPAANGSVPGIVAAAGGEVRAYDEEWVSFADSRGVRAEVFRALEAADVRVASFETAPVTLSDVFRAWYADGTEVIR